MNSCATRHPFALETKVYLNQYPPHCTRQTLSVNGVSLCLLCKVHINRVPRIKMQRALPPRMDSSSHLMSLVVTCLHIGRKRIIGLGALPMHLVLFRSITRRCGIDVTKRVVCMRHSALSTTLASIKALGCVRLQRRQSSLDATPIRLYSTVHRLITLAILSRQLLGGEHSTLFSASFSKTDHSR